MLLVRPSRIPGIARSSLVEDGYLIFVRGVDGGVRNHGGCTRWCAGVHQCTTAPSVTTVSRVRSLLSSRRVVVYCRFVMKKYFTKNSVSELIRFNWANQSCSGSASSIDHPEVFSLLCAGFGAALCRRVHFVASCLLSFASARKKNRCSDATGAVVLPHVSGHGGTNDDQGLSFLPARG